MKLHTLVSLDRRYPVTFPALVAFVLFAALLGLGLAFPPVGFAAPPMQKDLKLSLSSDPGKENTVPRNLLTLSVHSRATGKMFVYEHCTDFGHYWSTDRSQPVGYAYYSCETYAEASPLGKFDVSPQTMAISMFIDSETREECAQVNEGYHASYNNRFITFTCR